MPSASALMRGGCIMEGVQTAHHHHPHHGTGDYLDQQREEENNQSTNNALRVGVCCVHTQKV